MHLILLKFLLAQAYMLRISRQNEEGKEMFEEVYSKIEDYCNYRIGTGYSGFSAKK